VRQVYSVFLIFVVVCSDRLCGLVVRLLGYRSGGLGSIPGTTRKKKRKRVVGLERGPLSLVSTTEKLLVIRRMISTTEDTSDITRSFFSVALVCQVVTCAFHTSWFELAIIFGVPISLTVFTLGNIPFVFGWFEFYFALLYVFYIEYVLVIWGRLQFYKKHGKWLLSSVLFNIPDICDCVP
jgi:hypothetical protein